ncbi:hypothetical protein AAY473_017613 [Plecturocebus cupreus]
MPTTMPTYIFVSLVEMRFHHVAGTSDLVSTHLGLPKCWDSGSGGWSELSSSHCTPVWATERDSVSKNKGKKSAGITAVSHQARPRSLYFLSGSFGFISLNRGKERKISVHTSEGQVYEFQVGARRARAGLSPLPPATPRLSRRLEVGVAGQRAVVGLGAARGGALGRGRLRPLPVEDVDRVGVGLGRRPRHGEADLGLAGLGRRRPVLAVAVVLDGGRQLGLGPLHLDGADAAAPRPGGRRLAAATTPLLAPGREAERQREAAQQQEAAAQVAEHQAVADLHRDRAGRGGQDLAVPQKVVVPGHRDEAEEAGDEEHEARDPGQREVGRVPPAAHAQRRQQQPQGRGGQRGDHECPRHQHGLGREVAPVVRPAALAFAAALLATHVPQALVQHHVHRLVQEALQQPPAGRQRAGQIEQQPAGREHHAQRHHRRRPHPGPQRRRRTCRLPSPRSPSPGRAPGSGDPKSARAPRAPGRAPAP